MRHDPVRAVLRAARRAAREADAPLILAVSGGLDSMALLHAMAAVARARIAVVATLDHGTGPAAQAAAAHVAGSAAAFGLPVLMGRVPIEEPHASREAAWRDARYRFLRSAARAHGARIVTAHTEDDHVETVLMRLLRGSGARGLAGLLAPSDIMRPFLALRRADLTAYACANGVRWHEDPTNRSSAFLRNRVRRDLLPALRRADPEIDTALLGLARRAAQWRGEVEAFVDAHVRPHLAEGGRVVVGTGELADYDRDSLSVLWSALAGRAGLALDWRGTDRLAAFTGSGSRDGSVPLSGGWCVERRRSTYVLRRIPAPARAPGALPEAGELQWGAFRFRVLDDDGEVRHSPRSAWRAELPAEVRPLVRTWGPGDRLSRAGGGPPRRVKRYLSDAGLRGLDRAGWPVVVTEGDIVWIPGVRRSDAATARSGRPVRHYLCERVE
jgi:tRNA(Ile)-lysidine synthase